jgi:hypothetical protein
MVRGGVEAGIPASRWSGLGHRKDPRPKTKTFYERKTKTPKREVSSSLPLVGYARISLVDLMN